MAPDLLLTTVRFIHILAGVAWVGGIFYMGLVVARSVAPLPPPVKGPAMGAIGRAGFRFLSWAGAITILFGALNQVLITQQQAAAGPEWHMVLGLAFLIAVVMLGIAGAVIGPTLRKLGATPPPANAPALQQRMVKVSMINLALGIISVFLMVYATKLRVI